MKALNFRFFATTLITLLFFSVSASTVEAKVISSEGLVVVASDEVVDDDLFIGGETVTIEGTVNGDVYAAGGTVTISGTVNGDVLAAGGMIDISGTIEDDLRLGGGNIIIHGAQIGDNASFGGGNISIDENSMIGGSLVFGAGNLVSKANIGRGIVGGAGSITLGGEVKKDVKVGVGQFTLAPGATVGGDLVYTSDEELNLSASATVSGTISQVIPEVSEVSAEITKTLPSVARKLNFGFKVFAYFASLVVGLIVLKLFKNPTEEVAKIIRQKTWESFGWGFLLVMLAVPAFIMLAITGIGLPLAFILAALFVIELYLAKIFIAIIIGRYLTDIIGKKDLNAYVTFALGLAVYYLLASLPYIGFLVSLVTVMLTLGAVFSYKRKYLFGK